MKPLRLTPYAWSKLLYLRDAGSTEVGGFGISAVDDLLLIEDVCLIRQDTTVASVAFDDGSVADYFDRQVDLRLAPERFARIWIHTHPGNCPMPSAVDEETFARCFRAADWALMFILAAGGQTYARLSLRAGPGISKQLPVEVDFSRPFEAANPAAWHAEYVANVMRQPEWSTWPRIFSNDHVPEGTGSTARPLATAIDDLTVNPWEIVDGKHH